MSNKIFENALKEKGIKNTDLIRLSSSYYSTIKINLKSKKEKERFDVEVGGFLSRYKREGIDKSFLQYFNKLKQLAEGYKTKT